MEVHCTVSTFDPRRGVGTVIVHLQRRVRFKRSQYVTYAVPRPGQEVVVEFNGDGSIRSLRPVE